MNYRIEKADGVTTVHRIGPGEARVGRNVSFGRNVVLEGEVTIGDGCRIGHNVVLSWCDIGGGTAVEDNAVVGYSSLMGHFYDEDQRAPDQAPARAMVGENALLRTGATIYRGATVGDNCWVNHRSVVRENAVMASNSLIGCHSYLDAHCTLGERSVILNCTTVGSHATIEQCVMVGPCIVLSNNTPIGHCRGEHIIKGVTLRFGCALGSGVVINPGLEVGREAIAAGGAVLIRDVEPFTIVGGNPAKKLKDVDETLRVMEKLRRQYGLD